MKSRYIVFSEPNKVEMREEAVSLPESDEVLCEADKSLISTGTEIFCLRGVFDPGTNWAGWVQYPFRPGYSMAARVVATGQNVKTLREGDLVSSGQNHQSLFKAKPAQVNLVPEGISAEEATFATLAAITQLGIRRASHTLGETVGVVGLGILGQLVVQYLALSGARRIIGIDFAERRLDLARAYGATHTLALDVREAYQEIKEITNNKMLDVVYDVTGHPAVLAPCIQLVRKLGRVILLGDCPTPSQQCLGPGLVSNSVAILGIHGSMYPAEPTVFNPWTRSEMIKLFFDYLLQGRMKVNDLITSRRSPADSPKVYKELVRDRSRENGVILDWKIL